MAEPLAELRSEVAAFLAAEQATGRFAPRCDAWMRGVDRGFSQDLGRRGWLGITWPTAYGGRGQPHLARLVVTEELLRAGAPVASHWIAERQIGPAILRYGTEALKHELLPPIAAGELTFCLGMSESEAGSDLAAVRTVAQRDGDGFRVTGTKIWTTNAHRAEFAYVLAVTDSAAGKAGRLSEFVVDMRTPEVEVRPIYDLAGEHHFNEVFFDGAFVPEGRVIGTVGRGWEQVTAQLAFERGGPERFMSTYPLLQALAAGAERDASAAEAIGGLVARLRGLRTLAWETARRMDAGEAPAQAAAILKFLGTSYEQDLLETARRLLEPGSEATAAMLADVQLAMPGISLRGGSTEILAGIIAKDAEVAR
ncbi:acyl-CoA dehydrogenase [Baekduia soli]|uniref:Acyl-CoA dehydrogenase n=1 Tax=Baekduia soli TaxID=496014 RepID=A0A5B8U0G2_9ACTN|nr:acyl-CoA dehydrogenase family protein [Baekduia soli]QEC46451.1 acyl-CoA dehydrogenase [Baekduia soli]